jgi:hypothetical protein
MDDHAAWRVSYSSLLTSLIEGGEGKRGGRWHHATVQGVIKRRASYRPHLKAI